MLENWRSPEVRDIHQEISLLTIKIIMQAMFGIDATKTAKDIAEALNTIMLQYYHQAETFYLLPTWLPSLNNWQAYRAKKKLNEIVYDIVEQRRQLPEADLLSVMLRAKDENGKQLSTEELRDEVMTLLIAGHDTTANALTWTLMLLAQNPEVEAKLSAEVASVLAQRSPAIDDIPQLPYTEMVLKRVDAPLSPCLDFRT